MTLLYPIIFPITVIFEIFEFIVKHFLFYERPSLALSSKKVE